MLPQGKEKMIRDWNHKRGEHLEREKKKKESGEELCRRGPDFAEQKKGERLTQQRRGREGKKKEMIDRRSYLEIWGGGEKVGDWA